MYKRETWQHHWHFQRMNQRQLQTIAEWLPGDCDVVRVDIVHDNLTWESRANSVGIVHDCAHALYVPSTFRQRVRK